MEDWIKQWWDDMGTDQRQTLVIIPQLILWTWFLRWVGTFITNDLTIAIAIFTWLAGGIGIIVGNIRE